MDTADIPNRPPSAWQPETCRVRNAIYGKSQEELHELGIVLSRCAIQGVEEINPTTGKTNLEEMQNEVSDVLAYCERLIAHFNLDRDAVDSRKMLKYEYHGRWLEMLSK